jgi:hypothetical protein
MAVSTRASSLSLNLFIFSHTDTSSSNSGKYRINGVFKDGCATGCDAVYLVDRYRIFGENILSQSSRHNAYTLKMEARGFSETLDDLPEYTVPQK